MRDTLLQSWFERCCEQLPDLKSALLLGPEGIVFLYGVSRADDTVKSLTASAELALAQQSILTSVGQEASSVLLASGLVEGYQDYAVALQFDQCVGNHLSLQAQLAFAMSWLSWALGFRSQCSEADQPLPAWLTSLFSRGPGLPVSELLGFLSSHFSANSVWFLVCKHNRWQLKSISGQTSFDDQSPAVIEMLDALEKNSDSDPCVDFSGSIKGANEAACEADHHFCAITFVEDAESVERHPAACGRLVFNSNSEIRTRKMFEELSAAKQALHYLMLGQIYPRSAGSIRAGLSRFTLGTMSRPIKVGIALLLCVMMAFPIEHRIQADALVEGAVHQAIVAPFEGYIESSDVRAGDQVAAGQVLATLEERELMLELQALNTRLRELDRTYRQALAQLKHAKSQIVQAQMAQVSADVGLLQDRLARATLITPIDGVVISGDLSRALGSPVERGQVLFEVAPLENYRATLWVHQRDIRFLKRLQAGELNLLALPNESLELQVGNIVPVFDALSPDSAFQVEGLLNASPKNLRPGMKGIAKIDVGKKPLGWVLFHDLIEWWQLKLWAWLP